MCKHNEHIHWDLAHHSMEDSHTKYIQNPNQNKAKQADQKKKRCIQMNAFLIFLLLPEKKKRKQHYFDFVIHDIL